MVNALSLVNALVAILPAGVVFFTAYGRYDGHFRDQTVFLHFMGGLLMGGLLGFLTLLLYAIDAPLLQVVFPALLYPVALVAVANRKKWQGERHAVFNGGALGLGVAVMMAFSLLFARVTELTADRVGQGLLLSVSLAGLFFGLGLLAGDGARRKKPFRVALLGTAILIAPVVFLEEFFRSGAWLWVILLAAYGAILAVAAERKLFVEGLDEDARRKRRRARRGARDG
jgi:uncharacterized membrane protein